MSDSDGEIGEGEATRVDLPKSSSRGGEGGRRSGGSERPASMPPRRAAFESAPALEPLPELASETLSSESVVMSGLSNPASLYGSSAMATRGVIAEERIARTRAGLVGIAAVAIVALVLLQLGAPRPRTHLVMSIALGLLAILATVRRAQLRGKTSDPPGFFSVATTAASSLVALAFVTYVGALTSAAMILPLIVFAAAHFDSPWRARLPFLVCGGGYLTVVMLMLTNVVPADESLVHVEVPGPRRILLMGLGGEALMVVAFLLGRRNRRESLSAMERLERAHREIVGRQALLDEARAELEEALGAGKVGRCTGLRLGKWTAQEVIGRGGMGEVYRAVDDAGHAAALKVLHPQLQEEREQLERFFREAKISSDLRSPHIVTVLDSGSDGAPYLAMELLSGYDLADLLRRQHRLRLPDTVELVSEVARALTVAEEAGIVHRDLKPQNVFRTGSAEGGIWKVLDFGVSKIADAGATLTQDALVGTPSYMSPEQAQGLAVDHRSDVFSLGAIAYRAITGRPAFHASDPLISLHNVVNAMPARPSELVKVSADVDLALAIALAKSPAKRFGSAASFAAALQDASRGQLDERLREGARELLRQAPWGTLLRQGKASIRPPAGRG